MKGLTFKAALAAHELDVAGLEIWCKRAQLNNLKVWLAKVQPLERAKVEELLAKAAKGAK